VKVLGSIGHPIRETEFKVVDSETDEVLPAGSKGILKVRGPQVMKGYFKVICYVRVRTYTVLGWEGREKMHSYYFCFLQQIYWEIPMQLNS